MKLHYLLGLSLGIAMAQEGPRGESVIPNEKESTALSALQNKIDGKIVWSSSRANSRHDIWIMNANGTEPKALTNSDKVDWFPRFSKDGSKVLFNRSKQGWLSEIEADFFHKWDLWTIDVNTGEEILLIEKATWGTWTQNDEAIVFSRGNQVFIKDLKTNTETLLVDGKTQWGEKVILQEPNLSPDGKYVAITLRGSERETGILNLASKKWVTTGEGCQIDWFPNGQSIYRMNPTGNGGTAAPSEVLKFTVKDGVPQEEMGFFGIPDEVRFMDLPGRRSHEYFPKVDQKTGTWLVWGATDKGHDHDLYDYELYLWDSTTDQETATRLTFHTSNDRWPDIWIK